MFTTGFTQQKVIYTCVMHPKIQMTKPGNCPICGMVLIKKTIKSAPPKTVLKKQDNMEMPKDSMPADHDMNKMKNKDMKNDTTIKMDMPMDISTVTGG